MAVMSFLSALKRAFLPLTALELATALLWLGLNNASRIALLAVSLSLIVLGAHDWFQRSFALMRNYTVAARMRWLFYDLRLYLCQYIVEGDHEGIPYSFEARNLVNARARGKRLTSVRQRAELG